MGLLSSFNVGVSGMQAAGAGISVTGNNIANTGTVGFKKSRPEFQDLLASSLKGIDGGDQIGSGAKLAHVTSIFTQGNMARTENITDLAMNGNGFFVINAGFGKGFSRDGQFHFDKTGALINSDGFKVIGFQGDEKGNITNMQGEIKLGATTIPATPTEKVEISMNLDSRQKVQPFDAKDPDPLKFYNNSMTVYDNVGSAHLVNMYFNKVEDGKWQYHAMVDGAEAAGGKDGVAVEMATGTLQFNNKGQIQEEIENMNAFNFAGGAQAGQKIKFDFGKTLKEGGTGSEGSTQYGSASSISRHSQNGAGAATLASMSFNDDGILTAVYNNGLTRNIAQIAVAKFENNEGLFRLGKNLFKESRNSGQAALGKPGEDGRGEVLSKSIELSNVDIAEEFVGLMNAQRNFQANTRTVTTANKMLDEVLNIKR